MWPPRAVVAAGESGTTIANYPATSPRGPSGCTIDRERALLVGGLLLFIVANGFTLGRVPIVANSFDEIFFSDPAVNLARGRGLISYGQFIQPGDSLWVQHPPLYPVMLAGWYRAWGIGTVSTRALGLCCSTLSLALLWAAMRRSRAVPVAWLRLLVVCVVGLCAGFSNVTRSGRLDVALQLFFCLGLYGWSLPSSWSRAAVLTVSGAAMQLTGLQLDVSLAGFAIVGLLTGGRRFVTQLLPFAIGSAVGLAAFLCWAYCHDVLHFFWQHLTIHVGPPQNAFTARVARQLSRLLITDRSYAAILVAEVVATTLLWPWAVARRWLAVSWGIGVGVPLLHCVVWERLTTGDAYYFWPIELMTVSTLASAWGGAIRDGLPSWRSAVIAAPLIAAACLGSPLRHAAAVGNWQARDPSPVVRLVERHVTPADVVLVGAAGYYPAARVAQATYTYWYTAQLKAADVDRLTLVIMPDDERASFAYAAVGRRAPGTVIEQLGPGWKVVDRIGPTEVDPTTPFYSRPIRVSVLRRDGR